MNNKELITAIRKCRLADLGDAMDALGLVNAGTMNQDMRPIRPGIEFHGFAYTVKLLPARKDVKVCRNFAEYSKELSDWCSDTYSFMNGVTKETAEDMVIVVDMGGYPGGLWGSEIGMTTMTLGISGTVLDGGCRDSYECNLEGVKVFSTKRTFNHVYGRIKSGGVNVPVQCAGVTVHPGDVVCADDDGVLVIPRERAEEVLALAIEQLKDDEKKRRQHYENLGFQPDASLNRSGE
ncbi:MAG: hypothetical protein KBA30_10905 [Clostridia bacterium]|nr:hypothetical protein [Clostridia bacterium]